ncbi:hypothetical protein AV521_31410 [Streptomyces sp. IMTB 2501]|uniref:hypothetical protein n=1 Tax=Streptomyces sp. IMTB 2501 TaxID=1776340 RepID=UPI00096E6E1C|nr:hypothetical protein [Streptomyces sp. IMTB 2501]OLZ65564.1 hypothetical protein AV521_31410 [Streptomyces sp. IMTB 2501]
MNKSKTTRHSHYLRGLACAAAVATITVGGLSATAAPADAVTSGGGCRYAPAPIGFNVTLQPCADHSWMGADEVHARIEVQGMPSTGIRVWIAPATVNSDGSVTDTSAYRQVLYQQPSTSMEFSQDFFCPPGQKMVIDSWVTESGKRYGSVQSPPFWC